MNTIGVWTPCYWRKQLKFNVSLRNQHDNLQSALCSLLLLWPLDEIVGLDVSSNNLENVERAIQEFNFISRLNLSFNLLTSIASNLFCFENLTELVLDHNQLRLLPDCMPDYMPKLEKLVINHNFVVQIPQSFSRFKRLRHLQAENNRLEQVFLPPSIVYLDLSNNRLETCQISGYPKLRFISLRKNLLTHVLLSNLPKLEAIDLSQNNLSFLELSTFSQLLGRRFFLADNPFKFECGFRNPSAIPSLKELALRKFCIVGCYAEIPAHIRSKLHLARSCFVCGCPVFSEFLQGCWMSSELGHCVPVCVPICQMPCFRSLINACK